MYIYLIYQPTNGLWCIENYVLEFPDLQALCKKTLDDIAESRVLGFDDLFYKRFIGTSGGICLE